MLRSRLLTQAGVSRPSQKGGRGAENPRSEKRCRAKASSSGPLKKRRECLLSEFLASVRRT